MTLEEFISDVYYHAGSPSEEGLPLGQVLASANVVFETIRRWMNLSNQMWSVKRCRFPVGPDMFEGSVPAADFGRCHMAEIADHQGRPRRLRLGTLSDQNGSDLLINGRIDMRWPGSWQGETIAFWGSEEAAGGLVSQWRIVPPPALSAEVVLYYTPSDQAGWVGSAECPIPEEVDAYASVATAALAVRHNRDMPEQSRLTLARELARDAKELERDVRRFLNRRNDGGVGQPRGFRMGVRRRGVGRF